MSYILDALKKSQQARELGHVPTLESPAFLAEEEVARPNLLIIIAVILAALAVVIALYSVLRDGPAATEPVATASQDTPAADPEPAHQEPGMPMPPPPTAPAPAQPASAASEPQLPAESPGEAGPVRPRSADPSVVMEAPATPESAAQPVRETRAESQPTAAVGGEQQGKVPPDLIADIEAFKQEVRGKQSDTAEAASDENTKALRDLRLPRDVRKRLPEFVMSAHIYDAEPSRRFVLINGLKTREGEESREEIKVEEILSDGAVLSFDGHRFFQRR